MALNYAEKYSAQIDERFKQGAITAPAINNNYDFVGVKTVKVYSIPTADMNDYTGLHPGNDPEQGSFFHLHHRPWRQSRSDDD